MTRLFFRISVILACCLFMDLQPAFSESKIYQADDSKANVLLLVYRVSEDKDELINTSRNKRDEITHKDIKIALFNENFEKIKDIYERHGYNVGKSLVGGIYLKPQDPFLSERSKVDYPKDFNEKISDAIIKMLNENGCTVIDISPFRSELNNLSIEAIYGKYKDLHTINAILLVPYQAYSRFSKPRGGSATTSYGLILQVRMFAVDPATFQRIGGGGGDWVSIFNEWDTERTINKSMIDWLDDGAKGIISDEWAQEKVINNVMVKKAYKYRDGFAVYDRSTVGLGIENIAKDIISNK